MADTPPPDPAPADPLPLKQRTQGAATTTGRAPPDEEAAIRQQIRDLQAQLAAGTQAVDEGEAARAGAYEHAGAPVERELEGEEAGLAHAQQDFPGTTADQVKYHEPLVSPKDYEKLSTMLLAIGLIGGVVSRGNWMGVSATLNGAMSGYLKGHQQYTQDALAEYQREYTAALNHDKEAMAKYEAALRSRTTTINAMIRRLGEIGTEYDHQGVRLAAQRGDLRSLREQIDSMQLGLARLDEEHTRTYTGMVYGLDSARARAAAGGVASQLDPAGSWLAEWATANNYQPVLQLLHSRYTMGLNAGMINQLGHYVIDSGMDPSDMKQAMINNAVQQHVETTVSQRVAGVNRLTESVQELEKQIVQLTVKLNGSGLKPMTATWNDIQRWLGGSADLNQLYRLAQTVGVQYGEAMTMPGSNAQMHATTREWAQNNLEGSFPIPVMQGTLLAMNQEIAATKKALQSTLADARKAVHSGAIYIPPPGSPLTRDKPNWQTEQEWQGYNPAGAPAAAPPAPARLPGAAAPAAGAPPAPAPAAAPATPEAAFSAYIPSHRAVSDITRVSLPELSSAIQYAMRDARVGTTPEARAQGAAALMLLEAEMQRRRSGGKRVYSQAEIDADAKRYHLDDVH